MTGRRRRRRRKLLDDLKKRRGYSHLKEEALVRTMWRAGFGRIFGRFVWQTAKCMNEWRNCLFQRWWEWGEERVSCFFGLISAYFSHPLWCKVLSVEEVHGNYTSATCTKVPFLLEFPPCLVWDWTQPFVVRKWAKTWRCITLLTPSFEACRGCEFVLANVGWQTWYHVK
jgi:hypothetical protein